MNREARKAFVFHIMYGTYPNLKPSEQQWLRREAASFIDGIRADIPTAQDALEHSSTGLDSASPAR